MRDSFSFHPLSPHWALIRLLNCEDTSDGWIRHSPQQQKHFASGNIQNKIRLNNFLQNVTESLTGQLQRSADRQRFLRVGLQRSVGCSILNTLRPPATQRDWTERPEMRKRG
jgi:hypothetical protein